MKQSVKTSEGVLRSAGVQQNKNSGTRVANQTVDTTTNEGSKTMGRGFLIQTISPPLIFLGGMLGAARQKLCFPVFSPRSQNRTAVVIRGDCGVMGLPLAVRTVTPRGAYGRVFFYSRVHLTVRPSGHQPVISASRGSTCCSGIYSQNKSMALCQFGNGKIPMRPNGGCLCVLVLRHTEQLWEREA